jgi:hypothetical protein
MREAADILGVSKEAIRKRVIRGTLQSDTGEDGRRYVYLDTDTDEVPTGERDALISQLRDEVAYLREENRRKDEIIMQQVMTMRQLTAPAEEEPPSEAPGGPQTATDAVGRETGRETPFTDEERPSERRWWEFWR